MGRGDEIMRKNYTGKNKDERIDGKGDDDNIWGKDGDDTLAGHGGDDVIKGGADNDKINGGSGADELWGNGGKDSFKFNSLNSEDADTIKDFQVGKDKIALDPIVLTQLASGFSEDNLVFSNAAVDSDDYVLYDTSTGELWFDADGNGSGDPVLLCTIEFKDSDELTFSDFKLAGAGDN
jgi:Ca2+-binding RTX toxin-like protein